MSILTENWRTWYIGGVDSESRLRFLKFSRRNLFLGKFGPKKSKLSVLTENWHTWYLGSADSESRLRLLKFRPQNQFLDKFGLKNSKLFVSPEIGMHSILAMLILIPTLVFWFPHPKSIFGEIWAKKVKVVQFGWKLAHIVSRRCWFLFRHYFSLFPTLNPFLDKFGLRNSKLFILTKHWHTWYIEDADSYSDNTLLNCQP